MKDTTKDNMVFGGLFTLVMSLTFWTASLHYPLLEWWDLLHICFMASVCGWVAGLFVAKKLHTRIDSNVIHLEAERVLQQLRKGAELMRQHPTANWFNRGEDREQ